MPELENPPHRVSKESLINLKKGVLCINLEYCVYFFILGAITAPIYINKYYFYFIMLQIYLIFTQRNKTI